MIVNVYVVIWYNHIEEPDEHVGENWLVNDWSVYTQISMHSVGRRRLLFLKTLARTLHVWHGNTDRNIRFVH